MSSDSEVSVETATGSGIGRRRSAARTDSSALYKVKRDEIAEAAIRVFNRMGFQGASMTAVAEELGVERASLYYYFSSKEALFDDVVRTVVERNLDFVLRIAASGISPRRKIRELIVALMSSYGEHYPLFYIFIRENLSHVSDARSEWSATMREINRQTTDAVTAIIEEGYADKSIRKIGDARVVAYGIFGLVGWTHRWFRPAESAVSAEEIGKIYAEMVLSGIEPPY